MICILFFSWKQSNRHRRMCWRYVCLSWKFGLYQSCWVILVWLWWWIFCYIWWRLHSKFVVNFWYCSMLGMLR